MAERGWRLSEADKLHLAASFARSAEEAMISEGVQRSVIERVMNRLLYGVPWGPDEQIEVIAGEHDAMRPELREMITQVMKDYHDPG